MDESLNSLGWCEYFEKDYCRYKSKGWVPARVVSRSVDRFKLTDGCGEFSGRLSGKYLHEMERSLSMPVVGDWVAMERKGEDVLIHALINRKSSFSRKPAISGGRKLKRGIIDGGVTVEQALASNIDTVFIVSGLDAGLNAARMERYLTAAASGGISPVLLLNKADLCEDPIKKAEELIPATKGFPVHIVSATTGLGTDGLQAYLAPGRTVAFLGSSGVGKSTLINRLFGICLQETGAVNAVTGKGRHTTSRADLLVHESGCMLIDTPGIRELQLWCDEQAVEDNFEDVAALIRQCRFSDCGHGNEPGCAVREALRTGAMTQARYDNYIKLHSEAGHLKARKKQRDITLGRQRKRTTLY